LPRGARYLNSPLLAGLRFSFRERDGTKSNKAYRELYTSLLLGVITSGRMSLIVNVAREVERRYPNPCGILVGKRGGKIPLGGPRS